MKKLLLLVFLTSLNIYAQDMRENAAASLFSDYKAVRVGDMVTVLVVESSQATNQAQLNAGREGKVGFGFSGSSDGTSIGNADVSVNSANQFKGGGSSSAGGVVKTTMSAVIDSVLNNGLVRIKGSRKISINGEEQNVTIKGFIRTSDITSNNNVYSYNISEAEIVFEGSGMIDRSTSPGWLTKLFHWLF
jgi:flagellar L-ring protein precursor FlgH